MVRHNSLVLTRVCFQNLLYSIDSRYLEDYDVECPENGRIDRQFCNLERNEHAC